MIVKIKQREIDKDTMEQHEYTYYDIKRVFTTQSIYGGYIVLVNGKDLIRKFKLSLFNFECHA